MNTFQTPERFPPPWIRELEHQLPSFLTRQRWFGGKARVIRGVHVREVILISSEPAQRESVSVAHEQTEGNAKSVPSSAQVGTRLAEARFWLLIVEVQYADGGFDRYTLPVTMGVSAAVSPTATERGEVPPLGRPSDTLPTMSAEAAILRFFSVDGEWVVYEASCIPSFWLALADLLTRQSSGVSDGEDVIARSYVHHTSAFSLTHVAAFTQGEVRIFAGEQSQSLAVLRQAVVVKLFRRLEEGVTPDWELSRFLTEQAHFAHVPQALAAWFYRPRISDVASRTGTPSEEESVLLAMMTSYCPNRGDSWSCTLAELHSLGQRVMEAEYVTSELWLPGSASAGTWLTLSQQTPPAPWAELAGRQFGKMALLGQRTAELHLALADSSHPSFAPVSTDLAWQAALASRLAQQVKESFDLLRRQLPHLPPAVATLADAVLQRQEVLCQWAWQIAQRPVDGQLIRIHGDYHLGQVLCTDDDFVILDFEGEPARPLAERRRKESPLRDVAGMLRSFHYAAAVAERSAPPSWTPAQRQTWAAWLHGWYVWIAAAFLRGYLQTQGIERLLPRCTDDLVQLLGIFLVEKAAYELAYELNHRPDWLEIPLRGLKELAEQARAASLSENAQSVNPK
ncbi:Maltokinase [bacterium HR36]|nr:Maltokinase [bacterium HR36]